MDRPTFRTTALWHIEAGYPVIPLHGITGSNGHYRCSCKKGTDCTAPGKKSCITWRKDEPLLTADDVDKFLSGSWECTGANGTFKAEVPDELNIAVPAGRGFVVIDVDVKNGGDGETQLRELEEKHGAEIPKTAAVRTGSGGWHYYLRIPDDLKLKSTHLSKDVELKADGSYIVVPPSGHISGGRYDGTCPLIVGNLPETPSWVIDAGAKTAGKDLVPAADAEFPAADAQMVYGGCEVLRHALGHPDIVGYDLWVGALSILARCEDGDVVCLDFSREYSRFDADEVAEKAEETRHNMGARRCEWFRSAIFGDDESTPCSSHCDSCEFGRRTKFLSSPVMLGVDLDQAAIDSAAATIESALQEALDRTEPWLLVQKDVGAALARLKDLSFSKFTEYELKLATTKIGGQTLGRSKISKLIKEAEGRQKQEAARTSPRLKAVGESLANCPGAELKIPAEFRLSDDGLEREMAVSKNATAWVQASNIPIVLTGLFQSLDDSEAQFAQISYRPSNSWRSKLVPLAQLSKTRDIAAIGDTDLIVSDRNARHLVEWFHGLRSVNQGGIPTAKLTRTLGWTRDNSRFLLGDRVVTPHDVVLNDAVSALSTGETIFYSPHAGENQIADMCHQKGDFCQWAEAMASVARYPVVRLIVLTSFCSPLFKILDEPPFLADLTWTTSAGKTITLELASSVWFDPALAQQNWDTTFVGAERRMSLMGSIPLIIDDTATVSRNSYGKNLLSQIVYKVGGGGSRTRGEVRAGSVGLRGFTQVRNVIITSGEQLVTAYIGGGGSNTRILPIMAQPFGAESQETGFFVDWVRVRARANFGHGGERFIQYLLKHKEEWASWKQQVSELSTEIGKRHGTRGSVQRVAKYLAALELTARLVADAFPEFNWNPSLVLAADGDEIVSVVLDTAEDPLQCQKALQMVISRAMSQRDCFHPIPDQDRQPTKFFGEFEEHRDGNVSAIKFYPHVLRGEDGWLKRDEFNDTEAIIREWAARGWIDTQTEKRNGRELERTTKKVRISGNNSQWAIVINRRGLEAAGVELVPVQANIVGLKGEAA